MFFEKFGKEVFHAFNPFKFHELTNDSFYSSLAYFTKIMIIAFIIMSILYVPALVDLKDQIGGQISKFDEFSIKGTVKQASPITVPEKEPLIIIDATGNEVLPGKERITITRDTLFYKFFAGRKEVPLSQIKELSQNKEVVSRLVSYIIIFIFPSVLFFCFAGMWLKYMIAGIIIGTMAFLLTDLTRFGNSWLVCAKATFYSSTLVILAEVISSAVSAKWMFSLFSFWGFHIYLVPLLIWLVLSCGFVCCLYIFKPKHHHA
jgi:hypothetical protein